MRKITKISLQETTNVFRVFYFYNNSETDYGFSVFNNKKEAKDLIEKLKNNN